MVKVKSARTVNDYSAPGALTPAEVAPHRDVVLVPPVEIPVAEGDEPIDEAAKARAMELVDYSPTYPYADIICAKLRALDPRAVAWAVLERERRLENARRMRAAQPQFGPVRRAPPLRVPQEAIPAAAQTIIAAIKATAAAATVH